VDEPYVIVSSDSHAGPRLVEDLRPYCPADRLDEFDAFAQLHERGLAAVPLRAAPAAAAVRDANGDHGDGFLPPDVFAAGLEKVAAVRDNPGSWDAPTRLEHMDASGICSELILNGAQNDQTIPWYGTSTVTPEGAAQAARGEHIYNMWLADFCATAPARLLGVAEIPIYDIDLAVREVRWAKEHGLAALNFPAPRPDRRAYNVIDVYEPFWAVVEESGLPLVTHSSSGERGSGADGYGAALLNLSELMWLSRRGLGQMVFGGVFDRHSALNVIFVEQRGQWVRETFPLWDSVYFNFDRHGTASLLGVPIERPERLPSEYWGRNCMITMSFMAAHEIALCRDIGIENVMWGSDYPHLEGTWPGTELALRNTFAGVPEGEVRTILTDNGVRAFGLDLDELRPIADRIGPSPARLARPLDADEFPVYPNQAFRVAGDFH
jgi:predicted TIM-barrel fold metal-dependent hydrolase